MNGVINVVDRIGRAVGSVVGTMYQAGRDTIDTIIRIILPFIAFISVIVGIINSTVIGNFLAETLSPLASSLPGLLLLSVASPYGPRALLGPGA